MTDLSFLVNQIRSIFEKDFSDYFINRYVTDDEMIYILPKDSNSTMIDSNFKIISKNGIFPKIKESFDAITHTIFVCEKTQPIVDINIKELDDLKLRFECFHQGGHAIDIQNFLIEETDHRYTVRPTGFLQDQFALLYRYSVNKNMMDLNKLYY
jgi:hypothetical protein